MIYRPHFTYIEADTAEQTQAREAAANEEWRKSFIFHPILPEWHPSFLLPPRIENTPNPPIRINPFPVIRPYESNPEPIVNPPIRRTTLPIVTPHESEPNQFYQTFRTSK